MLKGASVAGRTLRQRLQLALSVIKQISMYMRIGVTGATWGALLATLRNESIAFYSASMGANFFLLASTYIGAFTPALVVAMLVDLLVLTLYMVDCLPFH